MLTLEKFYSNYEEIRDSLVITEDDNKQEYSIEFIPNESNALRIKITISGIENLKSFLKNFNDGFGSILLSNSVNRNMDKLNEINKSIKKHN